MEEWARQQTPVSEELIRRLHALVERGTRAKPSSYRQSQNVIRDSETGRIVYLPPEPADVPALMAAMVQWIAQSEKAVLPVPLIAGLAHYQFVTIHPFMDGNGRTTRLLATFLLHRGGYGLRGFFSLEEHHARDQAAYYRALAIHPHHNYPEGRAEADLTPWLEYFVPTMARVFTLAREEALRAAGSGFPGEPIELRRLDARARAVLALFARTERITSADVARTLGLSPRTARDLLAEWVRDGWVEVADPSRRARAYQLTADYRRIIGDGR
jgi:Fic family protein